MTHYIAMGGLHGYMPSHCGVWDTYEGAVSDMVSMYELGKGRAKLLKKDGSLELRNDGDEFPFINDGNEYIEITECNCDEPWIHDEGLTEKEWKMDHPEEEVDNG
jgi:hypothetical protein